MRILVLAATLAAAVAVPVAEAIITPSLKVVTRTPLVVRGSGFHASERVVVTAMTLTGPRQVNVRATVAGRFVATLRIPSQPCARAFAVRAVGARGSSATVRVPASACIPPPID